jgi:3-dehydroquinate synthase
MTRYECINVDLGERNYDIIIGSKLLNEAGILIKPIIRSGRAIIITDENIAPLYLRILKSSMERVGIKVEIIILPAGEHTKSVSYFENLINQILALKIDRKVVLVALGGGVIGDLTGYVAASILRGIDFVQVPTTLLSQVDSSVGGKTGINTKFGKNLIGAFYQPRLVIADIDVLDSLPQRDILAGYAEVAKYGLINDSDFFIWLEKFGLPLCAGNKEYRQRAVFKSCTSKAKIVAKDETEQNMRALLNLGHTFGHALETEIGFNDKLLHGESISIGICLAFDLSLSLQLCSKLDVTRTRNHFSDIGLPTYLSDIDGINWDADNLLKHMLSDKKTENGKLNFILVKGIGKSFLAQNINSKDVHIVIEQAIQQR